MIIMKKKKIEEQLQVKLKQIFLKKFTKTESHTILMVYNPICIVHVQSGQSSLFVLAMYCNTVSNTNLFSFSFFMLFPNIKDCTSIEFV